MRRRGVGGGEWAALCLCGSQPGSQVSCPSWIMQALAYKAQEPQPLHPLAPNLGPSVPTKKEASRNPSDGVMTHFSCPSPQKPSPGGDQALGCLRRKVRLPLPGSLISQNPKIGDQFCWALKLLFGCGLLSFSEYYDHQRLSN